MKRARSATPQWVQDIVSREAPGKNTTIYWYSFRPGYYGHGRGSPWDNWIKCYADDAKTNASLCLVLHEITHVLVPPDGIKARQRWAWHGPQFIKKVIQLYEKYGVLEYAATWERYKRIRNAIERYLIMNRYAKAAPSKEKEGTYVMIKCPVCGFKDATNDELNWKCPECEVKVNKIVKVEAQDTIKIQTKPSPELKSALDTMLKSMGVERKPVEQPAPATVREVKIGGLQCKIVTTRRK
jgi:predicted Zn-ribbon and HTH transcriptional regulator